MGSFDCVSIDSDLDSVCTQQVRAHVCRRSAEKQGIKKKESDGTIPWLKIQINVSQVTPTGWRSLLQCVTGLGSDLDSASLDGSEPHLRIQTNCKTQTCRAAFWPGVIHSSHRLSLRKLHTEKIRAFIQEKKKHFIKCFQC